MKRSEGAKVGAERTVPAPPPATKPARLHSGLLLDSGLAITVAGMALVALGVIAGSVLIPGIIILTAGLLLIAVSGVIGVIQPSPDDAGA